MSRVAHVCQHHLKTTRPCIIQGEEARMQVMSKMMVLGKVSMVAKHAACTHDELPRIKEQNTGNSGFAMAHGLTPAP